MPGEIAVYRAAHALVFVFFEWGAAACAMESEVGWVDDAPPETIPYQAMTDPRKQKVRTTKPQ